MNDKIYLRVKSDEDGNLTLVDQDDRIVCGILKLTSNSEYNDCINLYVEMLAMNKNGTFIAGKKVNQK